MCSSSAARIAATVVVVEVGAEPDPVDAGADAAAELADLWPDADLRALGKLDGHGFIASNHPPFDPIGAAKESIHRVTIYHQDAIADSKSRGFGRATRFDVSNHCRV